MFEILEDMKNLVDKLSADFEDFKNKVNNKVNTK